MPIIKSAKKRVKLAAKAKTRNARTRSDLRTALKAFEAALEAGKSDAISQAQRQAVSALDTAAKKSIIHANKAARFKARLAAKAKAAGLKPAAKSKMQRAKGKTSPKSPAAAKKATK